MGQIDFISTRGAGPLGFARAVLSGLASDGGLYMPTTLPRFTAKDIEHIAAGPLAAAARRVLTAIAGSDADDLPLDRVIDTPYAAFRHPMVAPMSELGPDHWMMELYHGPTLSFKDYALQPLGRLTGALLKAEGRPAVVIGATSGDTGSAAIAGFAGLDDIEVFIMHPKGRVSDVQRQQMTTVDAQNVHNISIDGTFDDCQSIAKTLLAQGKTLAPDHRVLSVNSINVGRILFQAAYHLHASARMARLGKPVSLCVPSGNFGNALSALLAARMGAPIARVIVATNANDMLARAFTDGQAATSEVAATLSPAMDIQVPSNLERLFHDLADNDSEATNRAFSGLKQQGRLILPDGWQGRMPVPLEAHAVSDNETLQWIKKTFDDCDRIVCPHTAVGLAVANRVQRREETLITVATAHPAKFPETVERALGFAPPQPEPIRALARLPERVANLPAEAAAVASFIRECI